MLPATIALVALLSSPTVDGPTAPSLSIDVVHGAVVAKICGPSDSYLGVVIVADQDVLVHYLVDVPPLLGNFSVLAAGVASGPVLGLAVPIALPPQPVLQYAQAVTIDENGILSSSPEKLSVPAFGAAGGS